MPRQIKVEFVGVSGKRSPGPTLIIDTDEKPSMDDGRDWDKRRAIKEFQVCLRIRSYEQMRVTIDILTRLRCWKSAFDDLISSKCDGGANVGAGLLWFWINFGLKIPSCLKSDLILLVDALRRFVVPYAGASRTLYRGECRARYVDHVYGIAWTSDIKVARMFANRRGSSSDGAGIVLKLHSRPEMIVADLNHTSSEEQAHWLGEGEYIVDPRLIGEIEIIE